MLLKWIMMIRLNSRGSNIFKDSQNSEFAIL